MVEILESLDWVKVIELILIPFIGAVLLKLRSWIAAKTQNETLLKVKGIVFDSVLATNQQIVEHLKKEGHWSKETGEQIKNTVKEQIIRNLTENTIKELSKIVDNLDLWIDTEIEASVSEAKE